MYAQELIEAGETMTLHLLKLCVGVTSVEDLNLCQRQRRNTMPKARLTHKTRQMPRRAAELSNGGSIYWVIKGLIQVRQRLIALEDATMRDGRKCCDLILAPQLVPVHPVRRRAFQGWRYLDGADAPPDLESSQIQAIGKMPERLRRELVELALI